MKLKKLTEKQFMGQVVQLAGRCGWRHFHAFNSRRSDAGWPDLVLARGAELIFVELKSDSGKVTAAQQEWLDALRQAGCRVYVWYPSDFDEIAAILAAPRKVGV